MDRLVSAMSLISIVVAAALSHAITQKLVHRLSRESGERVHPLATRAGSAFVFGAIFAALWLALSFVLVLPLVVSRAS